MFDHRGALRTCLVLLTIGLLALAWQPARASWPETPSPAKAFPAGDDLAGQLHPVPAYPAGRSALSGSVLAADQDRGPQPWRAEKTRLVRRSPGWPAADQITRPDRPAATCTVTSTNNSGPGTLRQCLLGAVGGDRILFDPSAFPPGAPATIALAAQLPWITVNNLLIDASKAGVILDGSAVTGDAHGLVIAGVQGVTLHGLQIQGFEFGVLLGFGATNNTVGGDRAIGAGPLGQGNLISGNKFGVQLQDAGTMHNSIIGNLIGTDLSGSSANGNEVAGIVVGFGAAENVIGGARTPGACDGPCNLISGNVDLGLVIQNEGSDGNQVLGNFVGTNLAGNAALPNNQGLVIGGDASGAQVGGAGAGEGNLISGNTNFGIWISGTGSTGNRLFGNLIGTNIAGTAALPNYDGILISESTANEVGAAAAGAGNLVSGNEHAGIWMEYLAEPGNTVAGNKIGTNLAGTAAVPNYYGVIHVGASNTTVGGTQPGAGNLISGNTRGLHIEHATLNLVQGNRIGTNASGNAAVPNKVVGVFVGFGAGNNTIGGSDPGTGNLVSGNGDGIFIQNETSTGNQVLGNRIGTNAAGNAPLPNYNGLVVLAARQTVVGGADTATPWVCDGPCNLIGGNTQFGLILQGASASSLRQARPGETARLLSPDQDNRVLGNFIGTNLAGTSALPNLTGVDLSFEATGNRVGGNAPAGEGNLISGNQREGIVVRRPLTSNNQISGNRLGTKADGASALANGEYGIWIADGASGNTVGGAAEGDGNLISGQATDLGYFGVVIGVESGSKPRDNTVIGNRIGCDGAGTAAIPNGGGVAVAWGATGSVIQDNLISGNAGHGVLIQDSTGTEVKGNQIGLAKDGRSPLGNGAGEGAGIIFYRAPHNLVGPANTIAYNTWGVAVGYPESVGNTITQNSIYANRYAQIQFFQVPQPLAAAPQLSGWDGATLSGTACAACRVEVFANPAYLPAGRTYLGTTTAAGDGSFSLAVDPGYRYLAATATDADGTTSEFSNNLFIGTYSYLHLPLVVK